MGFEAIEVAESAEIEAALLKVARMLEEEIDVEDMSLESASSEFGWYDGLPPKIVHDDEQNGRIGKLLEPIAYHQPANRDWPVVAGAWLDGASIPRALWTIVGGPYEGAYFNASIVHDHYCITQARTWRDTHRMFHDAMRCSGVGKVRAAIMYYAVHRFGPRWRDPSFEGLEAASTEAAGQDSAPEPLDRAASEAFLRDAEAILRHDIGPDAVAALADVREAQANAVQGDPEGLEAAAEGSAGRAALLVVAGGSGTKEDVDTVTQEAAGLPAWVTDHFLDKGVRIVPVETPSPISRAICAASCRAGGSARGGPGTAFRGLISTNAAASSSPRSTRPAARAPCRPAHRDFTARTVS